MNSRSIPERMRLSEKRRAPRRNKLRIHLHLEHTFPLWTPSSAVPNFLIASIVFVGNGLAKLLDRVGLSAIIPKRLLELREIAQLARKWKCKTKSAVMTRGARVVQEPIGKWMAFVRRTGLRADYVVDELTAESRIDSFELAMKDMRIFARDDTWFSLYEAVWWSQAGESASERRIGQWFDRCMRMLLARVWLLAGVNLWLFCAIVMYWFDLRVDCVCALAIFATLLAWVWTWAV